MHLGEKVKIRREELGLSQEELAFRMGYKSRTSINKIENGRPVSQKIIARLSSVLGVSISYLMGWEDEEKPVQDELSDGQRKLIEFAKSVPDDKAAFVLRVMRSIVEGDE